MPAKRRGVAACEFEEAWSPVLFASLYCHQHKSSIEMVLSKATAITVAVVLGYGCNIGQPVQSSSRLRWHRRPQSQRQCSSIKTARVRGAAAPAALMPTVMVMQMRAMRMRVMIRVLLLLLILATIPVCCHCHQYFSRAKYFPMLLIALTLACRENLNIPDK